MTSHPVMSNGSRLLQEMMRCAFETAEPAEDHTLSLRRAISTRGTHGRKLGLRHQQKTPIQSPAVSRPKTVWMSCGGPSIPIQSPIQGPSKSRLDGQSGSLDDDEARMRQRAASPPPVLPQPWSRPSDPTPPPDIGSTRGARKNCGIRMVVDKQRPQRRSRPFLSRREAQLNEEAPQQGVPVDRYRFAARCFTLHPPRSLSKSH